MQLVNFRIYYDTTVVCVVGETYSMVTILKNYNIS